MTEEGVDTEQAWVLDPWQHREREADEDLAAGRVTRYEGDEQFLAALDERMKPMLAKADLPEDFVQAEYQCLTDLAERGEDDPDAPEYFSPRRDELDQIPG